MQRTSLQCILNSFHMTHMTTFFTHFAMCWNTGVCQFVQSLDRLKVSIGDLEVLQLPRFIRKNSVLRSATEQEAT